MNRIIGLFALASICTLAAPAFAGQVTYTYDVLGRLDTVTYDDGTVVQYSYDSAGNRTARVLEIESADFSINNVTAEEGVNLTFTVTRSGPTSSSQSVNYATANGTALAGSDYVARSGTLSFNSGQTSRTVTVTSIEDTAAEPNETFYVNLSSATGGATISDSQGLGTITNDDTSNSPPNALADSKTVSGLFSEATIFVLNNDSDPDGDNLTITSVSQPSNAQVQIGAFGTTIRVLTTGYGTSFFGYTISDGNGGTASAFVSLTVNGGGPSPFNPLGGPH